ncbi:MAG TPA: cytochrome c oxidase subunit II [Actinomycetota bacterium]|nr:cytochrome c oxidase subunit II [Actinomycetota bacterium]
MIRKPERGRTRRAQLVALIAGVGILASACAPTAVTETGAKVHNLYNIVLVIAAVVFVGVEVAIIYNALRYRRHHDDETLPEQVHGNNKIEVVWTLIPSLIVLALFVMSMVVLADVNHVSKDDPLTVRVTGFQWQWKFEYFTGQDPDLKPLGVTIQAASQTDRPILRLPVGEPIHFEIETQDVIHSFYVPAFLFKRDLIPGLHNNFDLTIEPQYVNEKLRGQCAELCGDNHNQMEFQVWTLGSSDFQSWIKTEAEKQSHGPQCSPTGTALTIEAIPSIKFNTDCLAAPANQALTLQFDNNDPSIPHNVEIYSKDPTQGGTPLGGATGPTDTITGVASITYDINALQPGTYYFQCDVHTIMNGTFVVK